MKKSSSTHLQPLTQKEKLVLEFIESELAEKGIAPSYTEIKEYFGFASFNSVQNYLKQLMGKGYIHLPGDNQKRAIHILHSAQSVQSHLQSVQNSHIAPPPNSRSPQKDQLLLGPSREEILSLPLLGKVAAGKPIESFAHDEYVDVPPSMVRNPSKTFALKVAGDSMIDDGIFDGDIILVQKQNNASNGEIIVAIVDNEATVKRFYQKQIEQDKKIELRPANPSMSSMWFHPSQVEVRGVVVGLMRKF